MLAFATLNANVVIELVMWLATPIPWICLLAVSAGIVRTLE